MKLKQLYPLRLSLAADGFYQVSISLERHNFGCVLPRCRTSDGVSALPRIAYNRLCELQELPVPEEILAVYKSTKCGGLLTPITDSRFEMLKPLVGLDPWDRKVIYTVSKAIGVSTESLDLVRVLTMEMLIEEIVFAYSEVLIQKGEHT